MRTFSITKISRPSGTTRIEQRLAVLRLASRLLFELGMSWISTGTSWDYVHQITSRVSLSTWTCATGNKLLVLIHSRSRRMDDNKEGYDVTKLRKESSARNLHHRQFSNHNRLCSERNSQEKAKVCRKQFWFPVSHLTSFWTSYVRAKFRS